MPTCQVTIGTRLPASDLATYRPGTRIRRRWLSGPGSIIVSDRGDDAEVHGLACRRTVPESATGPACATGDAIGRLDRDEDDTGQTPGDRFGSSPWRRARVFRPWPRSRRPRPGASPSSRRDPARVRPGATTSTSRGSKKERYASFGVLVFEVPKDGDQAGDVKSLSLRLVQSIPQFAKERFGSSSPSQRREGPTR